MYEENIQYEYSVNSSNILFEIAPESNKSEVRAAERLAQFFLVEPVKGVKFSVEVSSHYLRVSIERTENYDVFSLYLYILGCIQKEKDSIQEAIENKQDITLFVPLNEYLNKYMGKHHYTMEEKYKKLVTAFDTVRTLQLSEKNDNSINGMPAISMFKGSSLIPESYEKYKKQLENNKNDNIQCILLIDRVVPQVMDMFGDKGKYIYIPMSFVRAETTIGVLKVLTFLQQWNNNGETRIIEWSEVYTLFGIKTSRRSTDRRSLLNYLDKIQNNSESGYKNFVIENISREKFKIVFTYTGKKALQEFKTPGIEQKEIKGVTKTSQNEFVEDTEITSDEYGDLIKKYGFKRTNEKIEYLKSNAKYKNCLNFKKVSEFIEKDIAADQEANKKTPFQNFKQRDYEEEDLEYIYEN